jgi:hypothetical protein
MNKKRAISTILLVATGLAAYLLSRPQTTATGTTPPPSPPSPASIIVSAYLSQIAACPNTREASAYLNAIRDRVEVDRLSGAISRVQYETIYAAWTAKWYSTP